MTIKPNFFSAFNPETKKDISFAKRVDTKLVLSQFEIRIQKRIASVHRKAVQRDAKNP